MKVVDTFICKTRIMSLMFLWASSFYCNNIHKINFPAFPLNAWSVARVPPGFMIHLTVWTLNIQLLIKPIDQNMGFETQRASCLCPVCQIHLIKHVYGLSYVLAIGHAVLV